MSKFVAYFATDKGKKTSEFFIGFAMTGALLAKLLPDTAFREWKREHFMQLYKYHLSSKI